MATEILNIQAPAWGCKITYEYERDGKYMVYKISADGWLQASLAGGRYRFTLTIGGQDYTGTFWADYVGGYSAYTDTDFMTVRVIASGSVDSISAGYLFKIPQGNEYPGTVSLIVLPGGAPELYAKQNGAWVPAEAVYVKQNGQWTEENALFCKQNGQWKEA